MPTLSLVLVLLSSAVIAVGAMRMLRLPPMLAYFVIGLALGPHTSGLIDDGEQIRSLAEFGLVFLMFSIGLEFSLPNLYAMRNTVLGLGGLQVTLTLLLAMGIAIACGVAWHGGFVLAAAVTMSSTAIVSKMMVEKAEINSRHGRIALGVLLFQDLAVVPVLILIPALAEPSGNLWFMLGWPMVKVVAALALLLVFGKPLINPWFDLVTRQQSRELFVLNVLMVTLLLAFATQQAGLSYALGAFIAGMLISETRYRYQVESDIAPFRDILLGLFFITIGMLLDVHVLIDHAVWILLLLAALIILKWLLVALITLLFGHEVGVAIRSGIMLAQAGEFSFVILALGAEHQLIEGNELQMVLAASLLSMALAPFIIQHNATIASKLSPGYRKSRERWVQGVEHLGQQLSHHVILCGYGRSGQYLSRFLTQENIPYIALDIDLMRVREASKAGENVVFGDAAQKSVLEAAGVARAKALVISYNDIASTMKILQVMQDDYPGVPVIVRTVDDSKLDKLLKAGAAEVVPEVLEGSLMLASHALVMLGVPLSRVVKRIRQFREERYDIFRGYFHGLSDFDLDADESEQQRLHTIALTRKAYACDKKLSELSLNDLQIQVKSIRRRNIRGLEPLPETQLVEGDVIVMQGTLNKLAKAEEHFISGP